MTAYYNENNAHAADWLRRLIAKGKIADGVVDTRSIAEVEASDLRGFEQVHLFAGIGGWSLALRLAGVPDTANVWTGSCPCQPFSDSGRKLGTADERHLWPEMRRLIAQCRPAKVFGEQVASKLGRQWFSGVRADLEDLGYGVGGADLCAAGVGAPHIRQRLWWVADSETPEWRWTGGAENCRRRSSQVGGSGDADPWRVVAVIPCRDGKFRRIKPGLEPLAHGVPGRLGLLRGYGNAIVPQLAAEFILASL